MPVRDCPNGGQMIDYRDHPDCETVLLTPELARQLLGSVGMGIANRHAVVDAYAETMAAGGWLPGSLMSIYADGRLRDGANRCFSVIASGVSITVALLTC